MFNNTHSRHKDMDKECGITIGKRKSKEYLNRQKVHSQFTKHFTNVVKTQCIWSVGVPITVNVMTKGDASDSSLPKPYNYNETNRCTTHYVRIA